MKLILIFLFSAITLSAQTPEWSRKYHTGSVTCLDFSSDGGKLLSGSLDSTVILWDISKTDTLKNYKQPRPVHSVQINSTGEWFLASLGQKVFSSSPSDAVNLKQYFNTDTISNSFVSNGVFFYDSNSGWNWQFLTSASSNRTLLLKNNRFAINILEGWYSHVAGGSGGSGTTSIIDLVDLDSLKKPYKRISDRAGSPTAFALSEDNRFIIYGGRNYSSFTKQQSYGGGTTVSEGYICELYDFENKKLIPLSNLNIDASKATPHNMVLKTAFTADSKKLLTANYAGSIHVRSVPDGVVIDSLGSQTSRVTALAADTPGRYYISAHEDSTLRIWTPGVHNIFKKVKLQSPVTTIAVSPDRFHFATAHFDGTVSYWNIDYLAKYANTDSVFTPAIVLQPKSVHVCSGNNIIFKTAGQSNFGEAISYQWRKDGKNIQEDEHYSGVQTSELTIENSNLSHYGKYTALIVTSRGDTNLTNIATLTFETIFKIKSQSDSLIQAKIGQNIYLVIQLSDTAKYPIQWYHNGSPLSGNDKNYSYYNDKGYGYYSMSFNFQPGIHDGIYVLKYWNECDTISSKPIIVEVETRLSIAEDPFKNTNLTTEPNPFKNSTTIHFSLPKPLKIKLAVTDILGQEVAVLKDGLAEEGENIFLFKSDDFAIASGTYFLTLRSENGVIATQQIVINR